MRTTIVSPSMPLGKHGSGRRGGTATNRPWCRAVTRAVALSLGLCLFISQTAHGEATVGAYYYPWWDEGIGNRHSFDETVRAHTVPEAQLPAVGRYNSRDPEVISAHIDQSHRGNISMWSLSWWGPTSFTDTTIRNSILPHARASELSYTIHYESQGRLGSLTERNYTNLVPDFRYLAENVFNDPNYMRIDGRPVVVMYLSRVYFRDQAGWDALNSMRSVMQQEYGYDPYIIGDHVFGVVAPGAAQLDAITAFDVYGQAFRTSAQGGVGQLAQIYATAKSLAETVGINFVPGVTPGYNDTAVRSGNPPAARYLDELGPTAPGSLMTAMLQDAVLPHVDVGIDKLILINSFNEWHEDTQIEATIVSPMTNTDDSVTGSDFTKGRYYEGYGNRYLDLVRVATVPEPATIGLVVTAALTITALRRVVRVGSRRA